MIHRTGKSGRCADASEIDKGGRPVVQSCPPVMIPVLSCPSWLPEPLCNPAGAVLIAELVIFLVAWAVFGGRGSGRRQQKQRRGDELAQSGTCVCSEMTDVASRSGAHCSWCHGVGRCPESCPGKQKKKKQ